MKTTSILLSCFNGTELVESYIDSLLTKDVIDNCTLIAVDFPFSHKNSEFVKEQLHRYPDIIYLPQKENISLYDAWNLAAQNAKTEFVGNLNLDDRVSSDYYKYGTDALKKEGADIFSSASIMTDKIGVSDGGRSQMPFTEERIGKKHIVEYNLRDMIYEENGVVKKKNPPHCAPIWRRTLHQDIGWFDGKKYDFCADYEFWLKAATAGKKIIFSPIAKTIFYAAPGTASDRLMHAENKAIIERWTPTFPANGYTETHLGKEHDKLHHCMNLNVIFSDHRYISHIENTVSIIVVTHERPDQLRECLNSIRAQDYSALDCMIVIDGEDDHELWKVTQEFGRTDKRFRSIRLGRKVERNYARNTGITLAIGKWVCIMDGDDHLPRNSISARVKVAKTEKVKVVFGGLRIFSVTGIISENIGPNFYDTTTIKSGWPSHCTLLIERVALKDCMYPATPTDAQSMPHEIAGEDVVFMTNLIKNPSIGQFINCKSIVYNYRRHTSSSYQYRHLSIEKVISHLISLHGAPDGKEKNYENSIKLRFSQLIICNLWKSSHTAEKIDINIGLLKNASNQIDGITPGATRTALDGFITDICAISPNYKKRLKWVYQQLLKAWPGDLIAPILLNEIKHRIETSTNEVESAHFEQISTPKIKQPPIGNALEKTPSSASPHKHITPAVIIKTEQLEDTYLRLLRFKLKHKNEDCILMCNGPSLKDVDFTKIDRSKFKIFGLNKIFLGFDLLKITPDYIVAINKKVIEQSANEYNHSKITKFLSNRTDRALIPESPSTFYMNTALLPKGAARFSTNAVNYVYEGWTVTHAALQLIYFMGFKRVYIVGMDHRFSQHIAGQENKESIITGDDKDHFHPGYFGNGQKWDLPDLKNSEISYESARKAFEASEREIIDCTINGACTIFKKEDIKILYKANISS